MPHIYVGELSQHNKSFFRDNKHLSHQSHNGSTTGLGLLIRAYKSVIYPMIHHGGHERSQYETRESKYRPNSSYQRNHRGPNPSRPYSTFRPRYYRNYPNERRENHTAEYPPRDTHPLTSYSPRTDYDDHIATSNPAPGDTWRGKFQPRRQYETEANYTMPTRKYSPDYRLPVPPATNCV